MRQEFAAPGCSWVPLPALPALSIHLILHHSSLVLRASEVAPPLPCALWVTQRLHGLPTALGIREEPGSRESQWPAWHAKGCWKCSCWVRSWVWQDRWSPLFLQMGLSWQWWSSPAVQPLSFSSAAVIILKWFYWSADSLSPACSPSLPPPPWPPILQGS